MWLALIKRSFQGLFVAIETMRIIKKLIKIDLNKVCNNKQVLELFLIGYKEPNTLKWLLTIGCLNMWL